MKCAPVYAGIVRPVRRRALVAGLALAACAATRPLHAQAPLKKLLILDFELIDEQAPDVPFPEAPARLARISARLRAAFERERLYAVLDDAPFAAAIAAARQSHNLLSCNGCDVDLARAAGAERILVGWVQKVSNLILNINIEVRDAADGRPVLVKSVDLRGNTDTSWTRGIDFLVRDLVEKKQGNR
jgi:hypothetical protein